MNHTLFQYLEKISGLVKLDDKEFDQAVKMYYDGLGYPAATEEIVHNRTKNNKKFIYQQMN